MNTKDAVVRYTTPTKYDKAPKGSICRVMNDNSTYTLYIQIADTEEDHYTWITMGDFLEGVFKAYIENKHFIDLCFCLFEDKNSKDSVTFVYQIAKFLENNL